VGAAPRMIAVEPRARPGAPAWAMMMAG